VKPRSLAVLVLLLLLPGRSKPAPESPPFFVVVFESPTAAVVEALAQEGGVDVRWVESGLVVVETRDPRALAPTWGGRVLGSHGRGTELALLRPQEQQALRRSDHAGTLALLETLRLGTVAAAAGEVWLLAGPPEDWPPEVLGCHGGLVLPPHQVDPQSLLDRGPPPELAPWVFRPVGKPRPALQSLLESVSEDSLLASMALLTRDPFGADADRHVFSAALDTLYSPRVQAVMHRAVQGIAGASVRRESFPRSRRCNNATVVDSTYNVIARLPGSVPGTGTFVVCAHIDATGQRNSTWVAARNACQPLSATPGAEDNATGVACVLEVLRCVAAGVRDGSLDFAFDLEFIAFSGEEAEGIEPPLAGSRAYVERRQQEGTKVLAAYNMDMVGSDSLGTNLQLVHNVASRWLADVLAEAVAAVQPPIALTVRRELDESLASDHNSFWLDNVPALLGADAPVSTLRNYASYHRPRDTGLDVRSAKLVEVSRAILAGVLRFESGGQQTPALLAPEGVKLLIAPQGTPFPYDAAAGTWRLWPGGPLSASFTVVSTGAAYGGPLQVEMWVESASGAVRPLLDCSDDDCFSQGGAVRPLQTADRLELVVDPVPILPEDTGQNRVAVRLTTGSGGGTSQTYTAPFVVAAQSGLPVQVRPNPVRSLEEASLSLGLERPGSLLTELYDAAGRRVASHHTTVQPNFQAREPRVTVPLLDATSRFEIPSGIYFARVQWAGPGGQQEISVVRLVVLR